MGVLKNLFPRSTTSDNTGLLSSHKGCSRDKIRPSTMISSLVYDLGKQFFGHPSRIHDVPIKLMQFCYITTTITSGTGIFSGDIFVKAVALKIFKL